MKSHSLGFWLVNGSVVSFSFVNLTAAQITADVTLPNNSIVRQQGNVTTIEGGTKSGTNLFHSFGSFSVPTGANPQLNSTVQINTSDIDLTKGLTQLPVNVIDCSRLIAQACPIYKGNSFIITCGDNEENFENLASM